MGPPGHLAIGLAAKPAAPKAHLWVLLAATELLDLLFFVFQTIGIESTGVSITDLSRGIEIMCLGTLPWSHGLFMCVVWSLVARALAFFFYRDRRTGIVIGSMVFSHRVLDFCTRSRPPVPV